VLITILIIGFCTIYLLANYFFKGQAVLVVDTARSAVAFRKWFL